MNNQTCKIISTLAIFVIHAKRPILCFPNDSQCTHIPHSTLIYMYVPHITLTMVQHDVWVKFYPWIRGRSLRSLCTNRWKDYFNIKWQFLGGIFYNWLCLIIYFRLLLIIMPYVFNYIKYAYLLHSYNQKPELIALALFLLCRLLNLLIRVLKFQCP